MNYDKFDSRRNFLLAIIRNRNLLDLSSLPNETSENTSSQIGSYGIIFCFLDSRRQFHLLDNSFHCQTSSVNMSKFIVFILLICIDLLRNSSGFSRPLVIGHRGIAYLPELTLASQAMSYAYEPDMIEIDVCLSRDNQLIVIHGLY